MEVKYDYIRHGGNVDGRGKVSPGIYYSPTRKDFAVVEQSYRYGLYDTLEEAEAVRDELVSTRPKKRLYDKPKPHKEKRIKNLSGLEYCEKCMYHIGTAVKGGKGSYGIIHCEYMEKTGVSRVKLHYERTGRQSLDGITHGKGCTEFEPMPPKKRGPKKKEASK